MAKGVGLDAGEFEVKVVELDGSYRKPRLVKASVDRVSQLTSVASDPDRWFSYANQYFSGHSIASATEA